MPNQPARPAFLLVWILVALLGYGVLLQFLLPPETEAYPVAGDPAATSGPTELRPPVPAEAAEATDPEALAAETEQPDAAEAVAPVGDPALDLGVPRDAGLTAGPRLAEAGVAVPPALLPPAGSPDRGRPEFDLLRWTGARGDDGASLRRVSAPEGASAPRLGASTGGGATLAVRNERKAAAPPRRARPRLVGLRLLVLSEDRWQVEVTVEEGPAEAPPPETEPPSPLRRLEAKRTTTVARDDLGDEEGADDRGLEDRAEDWMRRFRAIAPDQAERLAQALERRFAQGSVGSARLTALLELPPERALALVLSLRADRAAGTL